MPKNVITMPAKIVLRLPDLLLTSTNSLSIFNRTKMVNSHDNLTLTGLLAEIQGQHDDTLEVFDRRVTEISNLLKSYKSDYYLAKYIDYSKYIDPQGYDPDNELIVEPIKLVNARLNLIEQWFRIDYINTEQSLNELVL
jgi:hypothetical protein